MHRENSLGHRKIAIKDLRNFLVFSISDRRRICSDSARNFKCITICIRNETFTLPPTVGVVLQDDLTIFVAEERRARNRGC